MPTVYVEERHPFSRLHVSGFPGLTFQGKWFYSLEAVVYHVLLTQLDKPDVANELMLNMHLRSNPEQIQPWVVHTKGVSLPVDFICQQFDVYESLIAHLLTAEGSFQAGFNQLQSDLGPEKSEDVKFLCVTRHNWVFGTGSRQKDIERLHSFEGQNLFGQMLGRLFSQYTHGSLSPRWQLSELFSPSNLFGNSPYSKMLLLIGDSQLKFFQTVTDGVVLSISGGRYRHIVNALDTYQLRLSNFKMVIVNAGVNLARVPDDEQFKDFAELRKRLVMEASRRSECSIIISPGFFHPSAPGAVKNARLIKLNLASESKIKVIDWTEIGNPFVANARDIQSEFFDSNESAPFHLNPRGLRKLWSVWSRYLEDLKFVNTVYSQFGQAFPKSYFDEPPIRTRDLAKDLDRIQRESRKRRQRD